MRRTSLLLVAVSLLISQSAVGAEISKTTPVFGQYNCKPAFPCSDASNRDAARDFTYKLNKIAEGCAAVGLGMRAAGGLFDPSFGLDSSLCLTTKSVARSEQGLTMTPKCCIKPIDSSGTTCQLVCTKYGLK